MKKEEVDSACEYFRTRASNQRVHEGKKTITLTSAINCTMNGRSPCINIDLDAILSLQSRANFFPFFVVC